MDKYFWENEKYLIDPIKNKEIIINELDDFFKTYRNKIKKLPSFSSLKTVFIDNSENITVEDYKQKIVAKIENKRDKNSLRNIWNFSKFSDNLILKINNQSDLEALKFWINIFKEYYKIKKSEAKNG